MSQLHENKVGVMRPGGSSPLEGSGGGSSLTPEAVEVLFLVLLFPLWVARLIVRRIRKNSPAAKRLAAEEAERRMHGEHQRGSRLVRADALSKMINEQRGK